MSVRLAAVRANWQWVGFSLASAGLLIALGVMAVGVLADGWTHNHYCEGDNVTLPAITLAICFAITGEATLLIVSRPDPNQSDSWVHTTRRLRSGTAALVLFTLAMAGLGNFLATSGICDR